MELKDLFTNSSNETYAKNGELLEEHGLLNIFGSPNKAFLKFLKAKRLNMNEDELTEDLIEEFEASKQSIDLKLALIQRQKETIFKNRRVWINIDKDGETLGCDLLLDHDAITIEETGKRIAYSQMDEIEISEGGWSKKRLSIVSPDDEETVFEINEDSAVALKEILEDNIAHKKHDEIDDLLELLGLYEDGEISEEEYEARKAIIYSDDVYCTNCGVKIDSDSEFCTQCGHRVGG
ncbi:zinc ribbon domain-containing protein [Methanobrevibacter sp.]|uniref:zinc ribbon domain-containing protein n=1 Tax=Methanobrevibacter sp. TaxID=66852 RepID=UPI0025E8F8B4|nr:zinc ribbon domain-containing protein [Methanobrevibacter sp.]MBQ2665587.1 zinc ribbon domain-containing protein [Methanobrevibacter sp.]